MKKRKICVVTGTRAEYGLLYRLMKEIQADNDLGLQIIVTGAHLSPEFGSTYKVIEEDGFKINEKVEMLLSTDTAVGITKSLGLATIGFADAYDRLKPDIVVLLGDRYEILAAAQAALIAKIPVAHISGGDITEGAIDDAIRHSITKMAHLHFANNEKSAQVIRQLGENPEHIYNVGSLGVDCINNTRLLKRKEIEQELNMKFNNKNILVTFHPETLSDVSPPEQLRIIFQAFDLLEDDIGIIFTKANADPSGMTLNTMIDNYVKARDNTWAFTSLGQVKYLSLIAQCDVVFGNSSSGLLEVPSFKKPTINVGDRQKGRIMSSSVINCPVFVNDIVDAISRAFVLDCSSAINPYGDGNSSIRIIAIIKSISDYKSLLRKRFSEMEL